MIGYVDVGGGNRAAYGAGVLDYCEDHNILFDYCVGVSAGSANLASYVARQTKRNMRFYTIYNLRHQAIKPANIFLHRNVINFDYLYGEVNGSKGEDPLDYATMSSSPIAFKVVLCRADDGQPVYVDKHEIAVDDYGPFAASSNLPVFNNAFDWKGVKYYDGGYADPIPFKKALEDGCDKVIITLTLPKDYFRTNEKEVKRARHMKEYPAVKQAMINKAELYNRQLREALELEKQGKVLIIAPEEKPQIKTLGKDVSEIIKLHDVGYRDAEKIVDFLK